MAILFSSGGYPAIRVYDSLRHRTRVLTGTFMLVAFCAFLIFSSDSAAGQERGLSPRTAAVSDSPVVLAAPQYSVYRIPLRVHVGESGRSPEDFRVILDEINDIWLSQAGICFEMQIVLDDEPLEHGMDIWFLPILPEVPDLNGCFQDEHAIQVRDTPLLGPAANPARHPAARTAAHECGHGLSLHHRQDSDDNLMRSKTFGWQLNEREVRDARSEAARKALQDTTPGRCEGPRILPAPKPACVSAMPMTPGTDTIRN